MCAIARTISRLSLEIGRNRDAKDFLLNFSRLSLEVKI